MVSEEVSEKFDWRFDLRSPKVKTITNGGDKGNNDHRRKTS